jgi:hypothetical protein
VIDFTVSELETTKRDAESSVGKTFAERIAIFQQLMEVAAAMQNHLPPDERVRRARIAELLDPLPNPWWKNFRKEALAEYECQTSSN